MSAKSEFYRTGKGSKAHATFYCANSRRSIHTGDCFLIPASEIAEWAPCLACCSAEQIAAWNAPVIVKPATCANEGIKHAGRGRLYSNCSTCGKEGKVIRSTGRIRSHLPAS